MSLDAASCRALAEALTGHDYTVDAVVDLIGEPAHRALGRNHTVPAVRALAGRTDPLATLTLLWPLQRPVGQTDLDRALPGLLPALAGAGLVERAGDQVRALVDVRPYDSDDGASGWVVSDLSPNLDTHTRPIRPDFVLGVSAASSTLAELAPRRPVRRALDLGSGCGVQSLHLARHAAEVVATDLNPRAVALSRLTFALNGVSVDVREGSFYEPVAGELFDLIVTNPPYVMSPPAGAEHRLVYREGGQQADALVAEVVRDGAAHLAAGGTLQVLGNWAHVRGEPWPERIAGWLAGTGCDAHVVQREVLDPHEYVELWLADAGLAGTPGYQGRYAAWLDYFDRLGVEAVGLGWLVLHRTGHAQPRLRIEDRPQPHARPLGPALDAERDALALDRRLGDAEVLARCWVLAPDVNVETRGRPGLADPEQLWFTQTGGFQRSIALDTATAAVLGACDGELALHRIVVSVAALLDTDPAVLAAHAVTTVRRLLLDGFLAC